MLRYKGFKSKRKFYNIYYRSITGNNTKIYSQSDLSVCPVSRTGEQNYLLCSSSGSGLLLSYMSNSVNINLNQRKTQ